MIREDSDIKGICINKVEHKYLNSQMTQLINNGEKMQLINLEKYLAYLLNAD